MSPRGWFFAALAVSLVAFGPILSAMLGEAVAHHAGCVLNEGNQHPCMVAGLDVGGTLYAMFVMGWLMLLTIWFVPVALILWIVWLVALIRSRRG